MDNLKKSLFNIFHILNTPPPYLNDGLSLVLFISINMPDPFALSLFLSLSMCYKYVLKFIFVLF